MSNKTVSRYSIQLDIERSDNVARNINEIEKTLNNISQSAKNINLSDGLQSASTQAEELSKKIKDIVQNSDDATAEIKAYEKAAQKGISELEKQYVKISYSLSEQGTAQRARLNELKQQAKALEGNAAEQKKYKQLEKEIKALEKDVVDLSDDELKAAAKQNREIRARLKLTQSEARLIQAQQKTQKSLKQLLKDDIKGIKEKISQQLKFINALKTTEGRYNAIKKAAGKIGAGVGAGAKTAIKGAGIAGGLVAGLGVAAASRSGDLEEREKQARRIKGVSALDARDLLSKIYITTGADYSTIVDAINRVHSAIPGADYYDLLRAVPVEIQYPGASALFRQDTTRLIGSEQYEQYANKIKAIQGTTGASMEQVNDAASRVANMRQSSFSNASMIDLQALYLGLQNSGAYDSQEELDRAFNSFVRAQRNQKKSVFEFAQSYNWARTAYGETNKEQARRAIRHLDFSAIEASTKVDNGELKYSAAEQESQRIRQMEEQKNKFLAKIFEAISPIFDKLDVNKIGAVINGLIDFATKLIPPMIELFTAIQPYISKLIGILGEGIDLIKDAVSDVGPGQPRANGGLVSMPSLVGEAGPELVIPLDHSRVSRATNLTQYYTQNFSMSGNETTALSLSSVVRSRDFSRAISENNMINSRLGR